MNPEHEEAMRRDFARFAELSAAADRARAGVERPRILRARNAIGQRWEDGPHADQWRYLEMAHWQWANNPAALARSLDRLDRGEPAWFERGLTDVQHRSLAQVHDAITTTPTRDRRTPAAVTAVEQARPHRIERTH